MLKESAALLLHVPVKESYLPQSVGFVLRKAVYDLEEAQQPLKPSTRGNDSACPWAAKKRFCAPVVRNSRKLVKRHEQNQGKETVHLFNIGLHPCSVVISTVQKLDNVEIGISVGKTSNFRDEACCKKQLEEVYLIFSAKCGEVEAQQLHLGWTRGFLVD